ncbi:MAG: GNAT family N-acetyltransferase [Anaerolineae bacterium]|nr:GNAT family N-acetyltransferase [Anaerolineae bacterium]
MSLFGTNRKMTTVRSIQAAHFGDILPLIATAWRIYLRLSPAELQTRLNDMRGFFAEDRVGIRGFLIIEPYQPDTALIVAAGLRDTWSVPPFLDVLLPEIERAAVDLQATAILHVGSFSWLVDGLRQHGFETQDWIVIYERIGQEPPPEPEQTPAQIRTAHTRDLETLTQLDNYTFDYIWHMSTRHLREALANAVSFAVAVVDNKIVGYEWSDMYNQHAHLTRLAVHPDFQGQGIGRQLVHRALVDALAAGANLITLNTPENNQRSQALYQRFGFVSTGERLPVLKKNLT